MHFRNVVFAITFTTGLILCGAQAESRTSKISNFAGKYAGSSVFSSASSVAGTAKAVFKASADKEKGSLLLTSTYFIGGGQASIVELIKFKKRSVTYKLSQTLPGLTVTGIGRGRGSIRKRNIRFTAVVNFAGNTFNAVGSIHLSKRRLAVTDILTSPTLTATLTYALKRKGN